MVDSLNHDCLQDPFSGELMGAATDAGNATRGISREEQDEVAARSHQRAEAARAAGIFETEIAPLTIPQRRGPALTVGTDEGIRPDTTAATLSVLRAAFSTAEDATVTAGSASPLSDGAAAVVITSKAVAEAAGLTWIAEIGAHGQTAGPDGSLHSQPSRAIEAALKREGMSVDDLDLIEINEAFASVVIQSARDLGIDTDRINADGGAIALGHPVGASGARLVLHQALALHRAVNVVGGPLGVIEVWFDGLGLVHAASRSTGPGAPSGRSGRASCPDPPFMPGTRPGQLTAPIREVTQVPVVSGHAPSQASLDFNAIPVSMNFCTLPVGVLGGL